VNMSKASAYAAKFNRVFDYIDKHLDGVLPLEQLKPSCEFFENITSTGSFQSTRVLAYSDMSS